MTPRELMGCEFFVMYTIQGDESSYLKRVTDFDTEYACAQVAQLLHAEGHLIARVWIPTEDDLRTFSRRLKSRKYDARRREIAKHLDETTAQTDKAIQMLRDRAQPRPDDGCAGK